MFSFTGWKVGWVTGSPELVAAVRTVKQFLTYVSGGPFQYAVAEALALPDDFYASISADLRVKRDFFGAGLAAAGFEVYWPAGTYFITTDVRPLAIRRRHGVLPGAAGPGRRGGHPQLVFYDDVDAGRSQVRFAFCKQQDVLAEALARLARAGRVAGGQEAS